DLAANENRTSSANRNGTGDCALFCCFCRINWNVRGGVF
ncbi:conserved hypothetical protein, partial [delta proteobacterium NaphS2]